MASAPDNVRGMVEQLGHAIMRTTELKSAGDHEKALDTLLHARLEIFGDLGEKLPILDAEAAARELVLREKIGIYAALLVEEADIQRLAGQSKYAAERYARAIAMHLTCLELHPKKAEQTRMAIRALRGKIDERDLPADVRSALGKLGL